MSDVLVTIRLPEDLIERAKMAGVNIENQADWIIELIETQIRRQEAAKRLLEISEQLSALPDEVKPAPEEIESARREYWVKKSGKA